MNFREWHGLAPKPVIRCEQCGVEKRRDKVCQCHGRIRRNKRWWMVQFLAQCVDEARA